MENFNSKIQKIRHIQDNGYNIYTKVGQQKLKTKVLCVESNKDHSYLKLYVYDEAINQIRLILRTRDFAHLNDCLKNCKDIEIMDSIRKANRKFFLHSVYYTSYEVDEALSSEIYLEFVNL